MYCSDVINALPCLMCALPLLYLLMQLYFCHPLLFFRLSCWCKGTTLISACDGLFKNGFYLVSFHLCRASLCGMCAFILFIWKHISPWTRTKGMKYKIHLNWKWLETNSVQWDGSKFWIQVNTVRFTRLTFDESQKCLS